MRLLVNLVGLATGGASSIGEGLLKGLSAVLEDREDPVHVLAILPGRARFAATFSAPKGMRTIVAPYPTAKWRPLVKVVLDQIVTALVSEWYRADVVFMASNFACRLTPRPQVVLFHNSLYIDALAPSGLRLRLERWLFSASRTDRTYYVTQTDAMDRALAQLGLQCLPPLKMALPKWFKRPRRATKAGATSPHELVLFMPGADYPHKHHDILVPLNCRLRRAGVPVKFVITVNPDSTVAREIREARLSDRIVNVGPLTQTEMLEMYASVDAVFHPSLTESYGFVLAEAMASGVPLLVSDRPYARVLCAQWAYYFDPGSVESVLATIDQFMSDLTRGEVLMPPKPVQDEIANRTWSDVAEDLLETCTVLMRKSRRAHSS